MGVAKFWCEKQAVQEFKNRVIKVSNRRGKRKKKSKTKQLQSNNLEAKTIREAYRSATSGFYYGKSFLNIHNSCIDLTRNVMYGDHKKTFKTAFMFQLN